MTTKKKKTKSVSTAAQSSSRLIVKNLPKTMTEEGLRKHFATYGTITDCMLKYTPDGRFRRFAFIGFDSAEEAEKARQSVNKTFIGTLRLQVHFFVFSQFFKRLDILVQVEQCVPLGDSRKPRAWSKYAADSRSFQRAKVKEENTAAKVRLPCRFRETPLACAQEKRDSFTAEVVETLSGKKETSKAHSGTRYNEFLVVSGNEKFKQEPEASTSISVVVEELKKQLVPKARGIFCLSEERR